MKLLRFPQVKDRVGYSRMHIHRMEKEGKFPKRVQLGPNSVAWIESEVNAWIQAKANARHEGNEDARSSGASA